MGRPPVKSSKAVAAAQTKGRLEAETKFWDKQSPLKKLKRLAWRKLEQIDPLEVAATIALTPLIKQYLVSPVAGGVDTIAKAYQGTVSFYKGTLFTEIAQGVLPTGLPENQFASWFVSFAIAFIVVRHGGEIAGMLLEGGKGLGTLAALFLT